MKLRWLLDPQVLYRSRYDAIAIPLFCALIVAGICYRLSIDLPEYRELRYGTETTSGVVVSNATRDSKGVRSRREAVVVYSFETPDGRTRSGEMVYAPVRVEHLQRGTPVQVYYQPGNPARSTTADGLHIQLWWELAPQAGFLALFLALTPVSIVMSFRYWGRNDKQAAGGSSSKPNARDLAKAGNR